METYTNVEIKMENNENAIKAVERIKSVIMTTEYYKEYKKCSARLIEELTAKEDKVLLEECCCFTPEQYDEILPLILKTVAAIDEVKTFEANSDFEHTNCGYEARCKADYWNEVLSIETISGECFWGWCDECGEFEIYYADFDAEETYICESCGKELTEKDLFPYGLPEVKIDAYEIW